MEEEKSGEWLTVKQVCKQVGCSLSTLHRLRKNGEFPQPWWRPQPTALGRKERKYWNKYEVAAWFRGQWPTQMRLPKSFNLNKEKMEKLQRELRRREDFGLQLQSALEGAALGWPDKSEKKTQTSKKV